jgi:hemoglobin-like flavoprotein
MDALDVALLRDSFELVVAREPAIIHRFYEILFARHPAARVLFQHTTMATQEKMLALGLTSVLDHLDQSAWLVHTLEALGARHVRYGVTDEMYDWVGEALLAALAEAAGPAWTEPLEAAWSEAFSFIAGTMKAGAARAARAA